MDIKEIKNKLEKEFKEAKIIVQPNSIKGWNIQIISEEFENLSEDKRKKRLLNTLSDIKEEDIAFWELLTNEEYELYGIDLKDILPEDLPFWVETLGKNKEDITFNSLSESEEKISPFIITFYSLKGGVGRSTALAYTAGYLAEQGLTVIAIDVDLEAPGLASLFGIESKLDSDYGLLKYLSLIEFEQEHHIQEHLIQVFDDKELYCLPAGKIDKEFIALLNQLNFKQYYRWKDNPLHILLEELQETMKPDVILLDARTGLAMSNAPLLFDLSNMAMIFFYPNEQINILLQHLTEGLLASKNRNGYTPELRFVISPIPTSDLNNLYIQKKGKKLIEDIKEKVSKQFPNPFEWNLDEISLPIIYDEKIAYSPSIREEYYLDYKEIAGWILSFLSSEDKYNQEQIEYIRELRTKLLEDDSFKLETVKAEEIKDIDSLFIKPNNYDKILKPEIVVIRGHTDSGKTLLFRYLSEMQENNNLAILPPSTSNSFIKSCFKYRDEIISQSNEWAFEIILIAYQFANKYKGLIQNKKILNSDLHPILFSDNISLNQIKLLSNDTNLNYLVQFIQNLGNIISINILFDVLKENINWEKLFRLSNKLSRVNFKIFLSEEMWQQLDYKLLKGKTVLLKWDKITYFKTLLKQLSNNEIFRDAVHNIYKLNLSDLESWEENKIRKVLSIIWGERIRGNKLVYTDEWIWDKIQNGNKYPHPSPLHLAELFNLALAEERKIYLSEPKEKQYNRSLIRPKILQDVIKNF